MSTTTEYPTRADDVTAADPSDSVRWGPLLVVLAGTFMTFLDFFIVNVALPSIHDELGAGPDAVQLVVAGYGLAFAVGMISGGRLGDLYGRRRMFIIGLALFTLTSAACGLAPNAGLLVTARVAQGAAGALMTPQVLAILGTMYTGAHRAKAFAAYGLAMGIAGVLGQLLGGALIQADIGGSGWRGIFLINVPVGLLALLLAGRSIPESHGLRSRLDLTGTALVTTSLVAIVLPLVEGQQHGWPLWTWVSLGAAPLLLAVFLVHQLARRSSGRSPLVDLSLFGNRTFAFGSLASLSFSVVPPAFFFVLALYLQQGRGFTPLFSGVIFAAVGAGFFAAMLTAQQMTARLGRQILALGALTVAGGCAALALVAGTSSSLALTPGLVITGFGIGMVLVPLSDMVLAQVAPEHAGAASGLLSTAQQVGGALGVAVIGVVFYRSLGGGEVVHAFTVSAWVLAGLTGLTAVLVQLLPRPVSG
ncbi:MAG: major facilitator superfamily 1 [Frankiales bacterium]|nr:major facilitator superfamily 1 [Frankiales bacterium]